MAQRAPQRHLPSLSVSLGVVLAPAWLCSACFCPVAAGDVQGSDLAPQAHCCFGLFNLQEATEKKKTTTPKVPMPRMLPCMPYTPS